MRLFKLDGRLSLCASYVREGSRLADIGADHALLPIFLAQSGKISHALACDVNPRPLSSAAENIRKYGVENIVETRLSDGLDAVFEDEADDIVIAGMGGELIAKIISSCAWVRSPEKRLILQPMTRYEKLTAFLLENGFEIESQKACLAEGKYYTVLCARCTGARVSPDPFSCLVGRLDVRDETSRRFLLQTEKRLVKQSAGDPALLPLIQKLRACCEPSEKT